MKKVWIVHVGTYDGGHVAEVFQAKYKAEQYIKDCIKAELKRRCPYDNGEQWDLEEWEVQE